MSHREALVSGTAFALVAGLLWGLVFIAPVLLPDYPAVLLSVSRYVAFGLIALPLAWIDRRRLAQLTRSDWFEALKLSLVGNLLYYTFLAAAIQRAGAPLPTMIIGTLPVVIAITSNLRHHARDGQLSWPMLAPSLVLIGLGIACVNHAELSREGANVPLATYAQGAVLAVFAVACWTWYPIRNADWLRAHPDRSPTAWATAQGLVTLPVALLGFALFAAWSHASGQGFDLPWGPTPELFVGLMLSIGLFASWLGTLCWNAASQRLPTTLSGQLIVFETVAALGYALALRGQWPEGLTLLGITSLLAGVMWALKAKTQPASVS